MMTLKHITPGGHESIVSLVSASFYPKVGVLVGHGIPSGVAGESRDQEWSEGRAYLMNDGGKTVAIYTLNKKEQKL